MLGRTIYQTRRFLPKPSFLAQPRRNFSENDNSSRDESQLGQDLAITGIHLDEIDRIMSEEALQPVDTFYPNLNVDRSQSTKPLSGHNLVVIQPWDAYANFDETTDPELQLEECVSLGNTIHNWNVIGKKVLFTKYLHRKQIVGQRSFDSLKELINTYKGVSAVMFGVELLSGIQLATLERELKIPVYDRFTVVLNIFRQHARTKEARIQLALAELPYIRSHLREIHESSEYSSASESLRILVGGVGEKFYHQRLNILKKRESRLRNLLEEFKKHRDINKGRRKNREVPVVSIVGYTNCGKTSLIKFLTQDDRLVPKNQLFATLDVTVHTGQLPSNRNVLYLDTVGFISRIPLLLVEAFSATLNEVQESDLIVHMLDATHPDHRLQHKTVIKALETLRVPKNLLESKITVGNKVDLVQADEQSETLPSCDVFVSATKGLNMNELVSKIDQKLVANLRHEIHEIRIENGGSKYTWIRRNGTLLDCRPDEADGNYLICRVSLSPAALGRWFKLHGKDNLISQQKQ